jgi:hypothetical protein
MSDLTIANSTYQSGTQDSATTLIDNVDTVKAQHVNGSMSALVQIETILGSGTTLKGSYADLATRLAATIPSGTVMLFVQAAAPTGWTKQTTHNDKALRLVSGTGAATGGSVAFTTAFASGTLTFTSDSHVLTTPEIPSHSHTLTPLIGGIGGACPPARDTKSNTSGTGYSTDVTGGGGGHTHGITGPSLAVNYVDVIYCSKD